MPLCGELFLRRAQDMPELDEGEDRVTGIFTVLRNTVPRSHWTVRNFAPEEVYGVEKASLASLPWQGTLKPE